MGYLCQIVSVYERLYMKVIEGKTKAHESLCSNTLYGLCESAQEIPALEIYNELALPASKGSPQVSDGHQDSDKKFQIKIHYRFFRW
jgi:hypothetical protein